MIKCLIKHPQLGLWTSVSALPLQQALYGYWLSKLWWVMTQKDCTKQMFIVLLKDNESCSLDWYAQPLDLYYSCKSYTEHFLEKKNVYCVYIWTINTIQKIVLEKLILKLCCFVFYIFSSSFFQLGVGASLEIFNQGKLPKQYQGIKRRTLKLQIHHHSYKNQIEITQSN